MAVELYKTDLECYGHRQLPRFVMPKSFHDRADSAYLYLVRQCPYIHTLVSFTTGKKSMKKWTSLISRPFYYLFIIFFHIIKRVKKLLKRQKVFNCDHFHDFFSCILFSRWKNENCCYKKTPKIWQIIIETFQFHNYFQIIRERISSSTALLLAYTGKNLRYFHVRRNAIILKCEWPKSNEWSWDFYQWLKKNSR